MQVFVGLSMLCAVSAVPSIPSVGVGLTRTEFVAPGCPVREDFNAVVAACRVLFTAEVEAGATMIFVTCGRDTTGAEADASPEFLECFRDIGAVFLPGSQRKQYESVGPSAAPWPSGAVACGLLDIYWSSATEAIVPFYRIHGKAGGGWRKYSVRVVESDSSWSGECIGVGR